MTLRTLNPDLAQPLPEVKILGIKVNTLNINEATALITSWVTNDHRSQQHFVVTPNVEFILAAQNDQKFKEILNKADLSVPDSARLSWARSIFTSSLIKKVILAPLFLYPRILAKSSFSTVTGTDLVEKLCQQANVYGFTLGFLGGKKGLAEKLSERLRKKYPNLKVTFAQSGPVVDQKGKEVSSTKHQVLGIKSEETEDNSKYQIPKTDILFVAFGQVKQEKWISRNLPKLPIKVAIGVGGAFDYLSGSVPRAPKFIRNSGFEWLFRLMIQPWRIKRQIKLAKFVYMTLFSR